MNQIALAFVPEPIGRASGLTRTERAEHRAQSVRDLAELDAREAAIAERKATRAAERAAPVEAARLARQEKCRARDELAELTEIAEIRAWDAMTGRQQATERAERFNLKRDKRAAELADALAAGDFTSGRLRWSTGAEWFAAYRAIIARRCGAPRAAAEWQHWQNLIGEGSAVIARAGLAELAELRADLKCCDVPPPARAKHPRTRAFDLISKREQAIRADELADQAAPVAELVAVAEPVAEAGRVLYLVACSASKTAGEAPARDLYLGDLFKRSRRLVEARGADWAILSAKHGLVAPGELVAPYDQRLPTTRRGRAAWAGRVAAQLAHLGRGDRVVFLAGRAYRDELGDELARRGVVIEAPLRGLGIGHQRQRLAELVAELEADRPLPLFAAA